MRSFHKPAALFFHGVEPAIEDPRMQAMHHAFDEFARFVSLLKNNFDVLPLAMLSEVLRAPRRFPRAVFLMCDDGYANNLDAADVLEKAALPWTLFVSTRHIDTGARSGIFLARLFVLFAREGRYAIPHLGDLALGAARQREFLAGRVAERLKALDAARAEEAVAAMSGSLPDIDGLLSKFHSDAFLNWEQLRALSRRGVEIGAHAQSHWAMHAGQSRDYLSGEATGARMRIEAELGRPCRFFAYPFGNTSDIGTDAWQAVRDAGYEYAFTTLSGTLDASHNPYLMPRYGLAAREPHLASVVPSLRLGNGRLLAWQRRLAR